MSIWGCIISSIPQTMQYKQHNKLTKHSNGIQVRLTRVVNYSMFITKNNVSSDPLCTLRYNNQFQNAKGHFYHFCILIKVGKQRQQTGC